MFSKKKIEYVDFKTINKHLKYVYSFRQLVFREKEPGECFGLKAFIVDRLRYFELSYACAGDPCTYIFDKTSGDTKDHQQITGLQAYSVLCKYATINHVVESKEDAPISARPLLWKNDKYDGKRQDAICYDVNSAYSYAMIQDMPDTSLAPMQKNIEAGEIGFDLDGNRQTEGYSIFVFKLRPSPFKKFVEVYYKKKKNAKNKQERRKYKEYLNFCIGFLQNRDPYTRAQIVGLANDRIAALRDENTLYCSTDSIVSLVERPDLKLGDDIGEWKIEHKGKFAYKGFSYQWNDDKPSIRGKLKSDFTDDFDLLTDDLPVNHNKYIFNSIKGVIMKNETTS